MRHRPRRLAAGGCRCPAGCIEDDLLPAPGGAGRRPPAHRDPHQRALRAAAGARCCRRRASSSATRSASPPAWSTADEPAELLVLPRLEPRRHAARRRRRHGPGRAARAPVDRAPRSTSTACARYRPGTPASRIFWPALARGGELHGAPPARRRRHAAAVVLDPRRPAREEDLDAAVRAAASLCVHLARARRLRAAAARRPAPDRRSSRRSSAGRTCTCASRWSTTAPGPNVAGLASRRGPAALRRRPPSGARAARPGHAVGGGRYLDRARRRRAARARPRRAAHERRAGGRRAAFTVAGCTGYELSGSRRVAEVA